MSLAASSDLDPTFISLLERGRRVPSFIVIIRLADALKLSPVRLFAEGVVRIPEITSVEARAVYRLAHQMSDGRLVEAEGVYFDCVAAIRSAELQNAVRRKSGGPELTHLVEYIRTNTVELSGGSRDGFDGRRSIAKRTRQGALAYIRLSPESAIPVPTRVRQ
jgi:transcriptional regulator with XRE-family HTH domain